MLPKEFTILKLEYNWGVYQRGTYKGGKRGWGWIANASLEIRVDR